MTIDTKPRRKSAAKNPTKPAAIILAATQADGATYATEHSLRPHIIITPRSIANVRGRIGPVYSTPAARQLLSYTQMLIAALPCGLTVPNDGDELRIA